MQTVLITFLADQAIDGGMEHRSAGEIITGRLIDRKGTFILIAVGDRLLYFDTARTDLFRVDIYGTPATA